jgi:hypothetical protein
MAKIHRMKRCRCPIVGAISRAFRTCSAAGGERPAGRSRVQVAAPGRFVTCKCWPYTPITLRQGARVIEDGRRLHLAWSDRGRRVGR